MKWRNYERKKLRSVRMHSVVLCTKTGLNIFPFLTPPGKLDYADQYTAAF